MAAVLVPGVWSSQPAEAQEAARRLVVHIAASDLPDALAELSSEARVSIGTDEVLPRLRTLRLDGRMDVAEALRRLLAGSGYVARRVGEMAWRIERLPAAPAPLPVRPAETAPPPEASPVPIVVTATKQPFGLIALPAGVSVVGLDAFMRGNPGIGSTVVSERIEGLSMTSLGPGRNRLFLRGIADSAFSGESQSTVAIVLDEARLTYAAPDPDLRLVDIERVEVLKGPQGSLYGTGALGGIYHVVSHPAVLDETSLAVAVQGSVVTHGEIGQSGSVVANLPLVAGTAALRLVGYGANEPGWIDSGTRRDSNRTKVSGARAMLGMVPAPGWRLDLTGLAQWLDSHDSRYVYAPRSFSRPAQIAEPHDNDLRHLAMRLTGDIGAVDLTAATAMTWHDVDDTLDATVGADDFGLADPQRMFDLRRYRVWDSELRLRGRWGSVGWLAGVSRLDARQALRTDLTGASGTSLRVDDDRRVSHDTAAYFDLTVPLTARLSFEGGARAFRSSISERRRLSSGPVTREEDKAGITPSLALAWQPDPDRLFYVRYGSAFRQGGSDISGSGAVEVLKGDELASIEAGWREQWRGGGRVDLAVWYARWENVQSDVLTDAGLIETANVGDASIVGAEGSLELPLAQGWRIEAGADFTSALLTRSALGYKLEDRHLPVVPRYTLRGALRHDFALGRFPAWAQLRLRYLGPSRMSFDPAFDRPMGKVFESAIEVHATLDRWELGLSAQNLVGNKGNVFAYGNPLSYRLMPQYTLQQPLTVSISAALEL